MEAATVKFDYYYGNQAEQFSFIRIPRIIMTDQIFAPLSLQAKVLYSVFLDRMSLSMRNGWFDEENRVFIIYQIAEIQDDLGFSKRKAIDYLAELEQFGLVEKKKRGFGLPNVLYIKSFLIQKNGSRGANLGTSVVKMPGSRSADIDTSVGDQIDTSEVRESIPLEVQETAPLKNYINNNQTDMRYIKSNHIVSPQNEESIRCDGDEKTEIQAYEELIKENIAYDSLLQANQYDQELVQGIFELILETVLSQSETILIASERYPASLVKSKFMKLTYGHIDYVISCLKSNTTKVKNIKKYLLAALFNASSTMDGYYTAEVNHDFPQFVVNR